MRRNSQSNWRESKTNGKRAFLVGSIGQQCGIILKGQALTNVQKTSDLGLFMTLAKHFGRRANREAWLDLVEGEMGSNKIEAAGEDIHREVCCEDVERNMTLTAGEGRLN